MKKLALYFLSILVGAAMLMGFSDLALTDSSAEEPDFEITLKFIKDYKYKPGHDKKIKIPVYFDESEPVVYKYGEPIGATVFVQNKSNTLISKGFSSKNFILAMRIVNPKRRFLHSRLDGFHDEFPDAPPLPFKRVGKKYIQVAPCERLRRHRAGIPYTLEDLRKYYGVGIPGRYTAQVRISAMTFNESPCDVHNPEWAGVLTSNEVVFHIKPIKQTTGPKPIRTGLLLKNVFKTLFRIIGPSPALAQPSKCPKIEEQTPYPNAEDVPKGQDITFELHDTNEASIEMLVEGEQVIPYVTPHPSIAGAFEVRYPNPYPSFGYFYCQLVNVEVSAVYYRRKKPCEETWNYSFRIERPPSGDLDGDCIPDTDEAIIGTSPDKKTLFIRPTLKILSTGQYGMWDEFHKDDPKYEPLNKQPFTTEGIELVIIGDGNNSYEQFNQANYDPSVKEHHHWDSSTNDYYDFDDRPGWQGPPCDILEIKAKPIELNQYCHWYNINFGHIWFNKEPDELGKYNWSWDTKGYVPWRTNLHWEEHGYYTPEIYLYTIDRYFEDGTYYNIDIDESAKKTPHQPPLCTDIDPVEGCWDHEIQHSPFNADSTGHAGSDDKVAFNQMDFFTTLAKIKGPLNFNTSRYDYYQVRDRVLNHEIGHAVIGKSELLNSEGHCNRAACILFGNITGDWDMDNFVSDCGDLISERIHNSVHSP